MSVKASDHFMVPKHAIVQKDELEKLMQKDGNIFEKFPQISRLDPIVEELEAKKGEVIKIIRDSVTAGKCVYYRVVA